ncbi:MAG TPA: HIT domain-containing protein [Candidatus Polarisedimenticolaceae bacterium]|nr:HIT domain-containing protein [Candidatus Polarisedimenticolaceae bacterium]
MKPDCLFCKLSHDGSALVWENDDFAAIKDIHPKAPLHLLIMPKAHVEDFDHLGADMAPGLIAAVQQVAAQEGVAGAYNLQVNVGRAAGQEIDHLHVHLLARK